MRVPDGQLRLGLVLAGGLARCLLILGALLRLDEEGLTKTVSCVAGSSSGAFLGALYAAHGAKGAYDIARELCERRGNRLWFDLARLVNPFSGPGRGFRPVAWDGIAPWIERATGRRRLEDFDRPQLGVCATEYRTGRTRYLTSGPLGTLVQASCSCWRSRPVVYRGLILVDGAGSVNAPVGLANLLGADRTVVLDGAMTARRLRRLGPELAPGRGVWDLEGEEHWALPDVGPDYLCAMGDRGLPWLDLRRWEALVERGYRESEPLVREIARDLGSGVLSRRRRRRTLVYAGGELWGPPERGWPEGQPQPELQLQGG